MWPVETIISKSYPQIKWNIAHKKRTSHVTKFRVNIRAGSYEYA